MGAFFLGSLSIIGLPPFGGSWSKWYLLMGAVDSDQYIYMAILMISSLLSIGYLMPVVARAFFLPEKPDPDGHHHDHGEAPFLCVMPPVVTAVGCVLLFVFAEDLHNLLTPIVAVSGG
jgi:multicomponent Na+:H+ antiporter subunit D